jgi:small-conductance mechanosensitive channel
MFTSLLAGSGVLALVISVASQDAISNLVGGLMVLFTKPFTIGDIIRYVDKDITGVVEEITLRHTVIRTFENKRLIIPNATINTSVIENADFGESRICLLLDVDITYESDVEKAMTIFAEVIRQHPCYMDLRSDSEKANQVEDVKIRVVNFASSSVVLRGWVWAKNSAVGVDMKSDILRTLKQRYEAEGIDFAYPHMVVVSDRPSE